MAKNNKKTTITIRIIFTLVSIFLVTTIVSQLYIFFYNPLRTEVAMFYSTTESIDFKGISVRNEHPVQYSGSGVIVYTQEDGSKLAKDSTIAKSYNNQLDISIQRKIDEINVQIKLLEDAGALENTDNSQLESFNNQINNKQAEAMSKFNSDDFSLLYSQKNDYLILQCKKMIVRGTVSNYNDKIINLKSEKASLELQKSAPPKNVVIDEPGYFVSIVDGYESKLNFNNVKNLSVSEIEEIIKNPMLEVSDKVIGKIVDEYKWQFIAVLDTEAARSVFENSTVRIRIGSSSHIIDVKVVNVERQKDGQSIILFECDRLASEYVKKRVSQYHLILDKYTGIRIPSAAIRFNDKDEQGVYILNGVKLEFKKIKVILTERDFVLVEDSPELDYISLYDNIVVSGMDLHEGKIVA